MSDRRDLAEHGQLFYRPWSVRAGRALVDDVWIGTLMEEARDNNVVRKGWSTAMTST